MCAFDFEQQSPTLLLALIARKVTLRRRSRESVLALLLIFTPSH